VSVASAQAVRPSKAWYAVAGALAVAAAAWLTLALVLGFHSLSDKVDGFQRSRVTGQAQLTFTEPGGYVVYYEVPGADAESAVPAFRVDLAASDGGAPVPIHDYGGSLTYSLSGHAGRAVGTFRIDEPGSYSLTTDAAGSPQLEGATVAVGPSVAGSIVRIVLQALGPALALFLAGLVLAIVVAIRRNRARPSPPPRNAPGVQGWTT
jgi:hypothetical protein